MSSQQIEFFSVESWEIFFSWKFKIEFTGEIWMTDIWIPVTLWDGAIWKIIIIIIIIFFAFLRDFSLF